MRGVLVIRRVFYPGGVFVQGYFFYTLYAMSLAREDAGSMQNQIGGVVFVQMGQIYVQMGQILVQMEQTFVQMGQV